MISEKVSIRGVLFDNVTLDEAAQYLSAQACRDGGQEIVFTPNSEIVQMCIDDPALYTVVNSATLTVPDGIGIIKAARILGTPMKEKVAGVDLGRRVLDFCAHDGHSVYFLGGKPGVAEAAASRMIKEYPGLHICGMHDGYFEKSGAENDAIVQSIEKSGARVLYVCLGAPAQEKWICENREKMPGVRIFLGLGGSLDVYAGMVKRAPRIFIQLGLEWFYRLLSDPKRIGRMMRLPKFYFGTWKYKLTQK